MPNKPLPLTISPSVNSGHDLERVKEELDKIASRERRSRSQVAIMLIGAGIKDYWAKGGELP